MFIIIIFQQMSVSFDSTDNQPIYTIDDLITNATEAHLAVENCDTNALQSIDPATLLQQDIDGETPLHYAATNGDLEMCNLLLKMNKDIIHIKDMDNKTAYDWAVLYNEEYNGSHAAVCNFLKTFHFN